MVTPVDHAIVKRQRDEAEARSAAARYATAYSGMPDYARILGIGGVSSPVEAAVVGAEKAVRAALQALLDAGATEISGRLCSRSAGTGRNAWHQRGERRISCGN